MTSIDVRNATFQQITASLDRVRLAVYQAWVQFGPGTTRAVAEKSGIDLLTFRPRSTELQQIGLLIFSGIAQKNVKGRRSSEGFYRAATTEEWNQWQAEKVNRQLQLI